MFLFYILKTLKEIVHTHVEDVWEAADWASLHKLMRFGWMLRGSLLHM